VGSSTKKEKKRGGSIHHLDRLQGGKVGDSARKKKPPQSIPFVRTVPQGKKRNENIPWRELQVTLLPVKDIFY